MITKLDEALSVCVVLGTLTSKQASTISAMCEHELKKYKAAGIKTDFVLHLGEVMSTPGTIFVTKEEALELIINAKLPNREKETLQ